MMVAALAASGTHWVLLQSVAWTGMLASNLHTASLTEAVERTFDGKHPCCLCKQIDAGKKAERKTEYPGSSKRLEFVRETATFTFVAPEHFVLLPEPSFPACRLAQKPPHPPPRLA